MHRILTLLKTKREWFYSHNLHTMGPLRIRSVQVSFWSFFLPSLSLLRLLSIVEVLSEMAAKTAWLSHWERRGWLESLLSRAALTDYLNQTKKKTSSQPPKLTPHTQTQLKPSNKQNKKPTCPSTLKTNSCQPHWKGEHDGEKGEHDGTCIIVLQCCKSPHNSKWARSFFFSFPSFLNGG